MSDIRQRIKQLAIVSSGEARSRIVELIVEDRRLAAFVDAESRKQLGRGYQPNADGDDPAWFAERAQQYRILLGDIDFNKL